MLPFLVDPAWYEEFWLSDKPPSQRRSVRGELARVAVVIALLAGGSVALTHFQADHQDRVYQDWEQE